MTQRMLRLIVVKLYNASAMIVVDLPDETATAALAQPADIITLKGDLGTGKTTFARAFIRARGNPEEEVPSPTFTLLQIYECDPAPIWHFDLYRLLSPEDTW